MLDPPADSYAAALEFLYGRIDYERAATVPYRERTMNLEQMRRLLDLLGNPHEQLPVVHVAGTKGKGSTAAMISSILAAAGYRVGLYTSPHLSRLEERFAVNGIDCSPTDLVSLAEHLAAATRQLDADPRYANPATFFEVTTAMAFLYFIRQQVDVAVLEVGLGGRLDSTNVCQPEVAVITSISFDHTKQLGHTLGAIAGEKAGIIKPGVPVVSGVVEEEPAAVIAATAADRGSRLYKRNRDFAGEYIPSARQGPGQLTFRDSSGTTVWELDHLQLSMLGRHQANNASVALAAMGRLRERGWDIPDDACREGLRNARCPARIEVVARHPTIILDTAHNLASVEALLATLDESFPSARRTLIFAVSRDKDAAGMLQLLLPRFDQVYLTQFQSNPRYLPVAALADIAQQVVEQTGDRQRAWQAVPNPQAAWEACHATLDADDVVCVTGSFFLAADLRPLVHPLASGVKR